HADLRVPGGHGASHPARGLTKARQPGASRNCRATKLGQQRCAISDKPGVRPLTPANAVHQVKPEPLPKAAQSVEFYIPATSSIQERRPRTLKHGDTFGVFDHYGNVVGADGSPEGLYHKDTRYLSDLRILVNGRRPL